MPTFIGQRLRASEQPGSSGHVTDSERCTGTVGPALVRVTGTDSYTCMENGYTGHTRGSRLQAAALHREPDTMGGGVAPVLLRNATFGSSNLYPNDGSRPGPSGGTPMLHSACFGAMAKRPGSQRPHSPIRIGRWTVREDRTGTGEE